MDNANQFTIVEDRATVLVEVHRIGKSNIYRLNFPDNRMPLVLTKAEKVGGIKFWTSVPEGRQNEAEAFGDLIDKHLNS